MKTLIVNALWKNQNWFGRIQTVLIVLLMVSLLYFRTMFGIYKHKEIQRLKSERKELSEEIETLTKIRNNNNNRTKKITKSYKEKANIIDQKRKNDEKIINSSTITDKQRNDFVSKYEKR